MFCPNCGTQVADGVAFCGNCGTPMGAPAQPSPAAPVPPAAQPASAPRQVMSPTPRRGAAPQGAPATQFAPNRPGAARPVSHRPAPSALIGSFTPLQLGALVAAIVAVICALIPWIGVNPEITTLYNTNVANLQSSLNSMSSTAGLVTLPLLDGSMNFFGLAGFANEWGEVFKQTSMMGSSAGYVAGTPASPQDLINAVGIISTSFTILGVVWVAAMLLVVAGGVRYFLTGGQKRGLFYAGVIFLGQLGIIFSCVYGTIGALTLTVVTASIASIPCILCIIACIVALTLALVAGKATPAAPRQYR